MNRKQFAWDYWTKAGYNPYATAAILGAIQQESNFDPRAQNPSSMATGLAQWLGPRYTHGSARGIFSGTNEERFQKQLDFMRYELEQGEEKRVGKALKGVGDLTSAIKAMASYERFKGWDDPTMQGQEWGNRVKHTNQFYTAYQNMGGYKMPDQNITASRIMPSAKVAPSISTKKVASNMMEGFNYEDEYKRMMDAQGQSLTWAGMQDVLNQPRGSMLPWAIGTGVGLLGSLGSVLFPKKKNLPSTGMARQRFNDLTNLNSPYWKQALNYYKETLSQSQPTLNTLYGFNRSAGISTAGATSLANRQAAAQTGRVNEEAKQAMMRQFLASEDAASRYLGMQMQGEQQEMQDPDSVGSFFENILTGGMSGLLKYVV